MEDFGKISKEQDGYKVVFSRQLAFPAKAVWEAITKPEKIRIWFMDFQIDFKVGGEMIMTFADEAKTVTYGKVREIEVGKVFEYEWEGEILRWEIEATGKTTCTLTLIHSRISDNYVPSVPAGWHIVLRHLEEVLSGRTIPIVQKGETEEQKQLKEAYNKILEQHQISPAR